MADGFEAGKRGADQLGSGGVIPAFETDLWFTKEVLPLEAALMQFLNRHWHNKNEIADLRQEVYVRLLASAQQKIPDHTGQLVFTIARNLLIDRVRRAQIVPIEAGADLEALEIAMDEPGPERAAIARDELRRLQAALDRLPPRCREAFVLGRIEGLTGREIAQRMGIGAATVSEHLTNGLCALADSIGGDDQGRKR
ncbi:MAG TPA: RNA polymerase sigma factor [Rhizomicrobium sp.]|nr:RNA polymerase sigma factor [Rhizomicrobium sp.]